MKRIVDTIVDMGYEINECTWEIDMNNIIVYAPNKIEKRLLKLNS